MNSKVDGYFDQADQWCAELKLLRKIILRSDLTEELKWGKPCYTFRKGNIAILMSLKEHCALMFCKGALLKDAHGLLTQPGENTQSGRWIKFASVAEIKREEAVLKAYLEEAIEIERAGLEVRYKETAEYPVPEELRKSLLSDVALQAAFGALTPGRQRGYLLYFSAGKQSKTRESRIEKCRERILSGKGLNDR